MFGGKYKSDARVTTLENQTHNLENDLNAIKSHMGFIEFSPVGEILEANDLFLAVIGYKREEVQGQHHRILCERNYASSQEYLSFWEALRAGDAQRGTFRRVGKNGQEQRPTYSTLQDANHDVGDFFFVPTAEPAKVAGVY